MKHLETQVLGGFNNTLIDQPSRFRVVAGDRDIPYETLIANTPVIAEEGLPDWDEKKLYPADRLADFHGRNIEVLADRVHVTDQYRNTYSSICIKGTDFSNPYFYRSPTAQRGYIVRGLQESIVMERVLRTSHLLRRHGVGTEYICGLVQPERFPLNQSGDEIVRTETVELPQFIERLCAKFAIAHCEDEEKSFLQLKAEMVERFQDCDYLISYRAMDCPYRLGELSDPQKLEQFKTFLKDQDLKKREHRYVDSLDITKHMQEFISPRFGRNLAKMHRLGLVHQFLHSHNITALGSIVDLDSCKGSILGLDDDEPTENEYLADVIGGLQTIDEVVGPQDYMDLPQQFERVEPTHYASAIYLYCYLNERFTNINDKLSFLSALVLEINNATEAFLDPRKRLLFTHSVTGAYMMLWSKVKEKTKQTVQEDLFDLDVSKSIERHDHSCGFLYVLPPEYFKENIDRILSSTWTKDSDTTSQDPACDIEANPPIIANIQAIYLEILAGRYRGGTEQKIADPAAFLYTFTQVLYGFNPQGHENEHIEALRIHHKQQLHKIIEHFTMHRLPPYEGEVDERWLTNTGAIYLASNPKGLVPVVFLKMKKSTLLC